MTRPSSGAHDSSIPDHQALAQAGGYRVDADPDQERRWMWVREIGGQHVEGCDCSFDSEDEAWVAAAMEIASETMGEQDLSGEQWDALGLEQQLAHVRDLMESYG